MPTLLSLEELENSLATTYSQMVLEESKVRRRENINTFLDLEREGLEYNELESRILLYRTLSGEKIYIQYPGKESANAEPMPKDFRPKVELANGIFMQDASFGLIWDLLDQIGRRFNEYLPLVATLFYYMGYMYDFRCTDENCEYKKIAIIEDRAEVVHSSIIHMSWYHFNLSDDQWYSLNNYIRAIQLPDGNTISFEGFIKFVDLLLQNEDCKYYYKNVVLQGNETYDLRNGRVPTAHTNLAIISYLQGHISLSEILNKIQKGRGVASFRKSDYEQVTAGIVRQ